MGRLGGGDQVPRVSGEARGWGSGALGEWGVDRVSGEARGWGLG